MALQYIVGQHGGDCGLTLSRNLLRVNSARFSRVKDRNRVMQEGILTQLDVVSLGVKVYLDWQTFCPCLSIILHKHSLIE